MLLGMYPQDPQLEQLDDVKNLRNQMGQLYDQQPVWIQQRLIQLIFKVYEFKADVKKTKDFSIKTPKTKEEI